MNNKRKRKKKRFALGDGGERKGWGGEEERNGPMYAHMNK
jgi:hypothetical protein